MPRVSTMIAICMFLISAGNVSHAHKISVFAWTEGDSIQGEASFAGGNPVKNCAVELQDASGKVLGATNTNGQGVFFLPLVKQDDLKIIVSAGEGHRGVYEMSAKTADELETEYLLDRMSGPRIEIEDVEKAIEHVLEHELASIRKQLAEMKQDRISIKDIIAGVGFILGIFGAYALGRKSGKR